MLSTLQLARVCGQTTDSIRDMQRRFPDLMGIKRGRDWFYTATEAAGFWLARELARDDAAPLRTALLIGKAVAPAIVSAIRSVDSDFAPRFAWSWASCSDLQAGQTKGSWTHSNARLGDLLAMQRDGDFFHLVDVQRVIARIPGELIKTIQEEATQ